MAMVSAVRRTVYLASCLRRLLLTGVCQPFPLLRGDHQTEKRRCHNLRGTSGGTNAKTLTISLFTNDFLKDASLPG